MNEVKNKSFECIYEWLDTKEGETNFYKIAKVREDKKSYPNKIC